MTGTELMKFYARLKGQPVARNRDLLARVGLAEAATGASPPIPRACASASASPRR
jgi:ABC-type multidrug transport system ATPase subunit